jgi:arabinan endo-1,5-alpha-L-arabinosidase
MRNLARSILILIILLATSPQLVLPQTATLAPDTFRNPVLNQDFPDPDVLEINGTYYAYATNSNGINIQAAQSDDLVTWEYVGEVLPDHPAWADPDFGWMWAPDVSAVGDGYLMYFTARFAINEGGTQCIGTATSNDPLGPFEPVGDAPLICQISQGGSIDPSSFVDADGTRYILWKNDGNNGGGQAWLYIQKTSDDGLTLVGEPTRLMTADKAWEGVLVEAPILWQHNDQYYLFYSANSYLSQDYAVGYAVADEITGPYTKPRRGPFLGTSIRAGLVGPGGQDIVLDDEGDPWMVFHTWSGGSYRAMNLIALQWQDDVPLVEPSRDPQPAP